MAFCIISVRIQSSELSICNVCFSESDAQAYWHIRENVIQWPFSLSQLPTFLSFSFSRSLFPSIFVRAKYNTVGNKNTWSNYFLSNAIFWMNIQRCASKLKQILLQWIIATTNITHLFSLSLSPPPPHSLSLSTIHTLISTRISTF